LNDHKLMIVCSGIRKDTPIREPRRRVGIREGMELEHSSEEM
jgi:hypothetical protein